MALRGTTTAISVEQFADADGAVQRFHPLLDPVRKQPPQSEHDGGVGVGGAVGPLAMESVGMAAAQLYPFETEDTSELEPHHPARGLGAQNNAVDVTLPLDPEDPTVNIQQNNKDRTLLTAQKYDFADTDPPLPSSSREFLDEGTTTKRASEFEVPARFLGADVRSSVKSSDTMHASSLQQQQQFPMFLGGLLAFVVAGVLVKKIRHSHEKKHKTFDEP